MVQNCLYSNRLGGLPFFPANHCIGHSVFIFSTYPHPTFDIPSLLMALMGGLVVYREVLGPSEDLSCGHMKSRALGT